MVLSARLSYTSNSINAVWSSEFLHRLLSMTLSELSLKSALQMMQVSKHVGLNYSTESIHELLRLLLNSAAVLVLSQQSTVKELSCI